MRKIRRKRKKSEETVPRSSEPLRGICCAAVRRGKISRRGTVGAWACPDAHEFHTPNLRGVRLPLQGKAFLCSVSLYADFYRSVIVGWRARHASPLHLISNCPPPLQDCAGGAAAVFPSSGPLVAFAFLSRKTEYERISLCGERKPAPDALQMAIQLV